MPVDVCIPDRQLPIHQLNKLNEKGTKREDFFPISVVQAIFDKTGIRLDAIISSFNYLFLPWQGSKEATRLQVVGLMRRKSLVVCYRDLEDEITIEMHVSNHRSDEEWVKDENWESFLDWIKKVIEEIFGNIEDFPDLIEIIKNAIEEWLNEYIGDKIEEVVNEYLENIDLDQLIEEALNNYFTNHPGIIEEIINNYLEDAGLEDIIGEYFDQIKEYLLNNERVIANALARHEQAIIELQNT